MKGEPAAGPADGGGSLWHDWSVIAAFQDDGYKIAAPAIICVTIILVVALPAAIRAWRLDRQDRRARRVDMAHLARRIEQERTKRHGGFLDLDRRD
ncbi:MAG: hypothetical protein LDL44_11720 [Caenispirillum sp.]|nr:hypothetical protein [Caenispirillum sp.]